MKKFFLDQRIIFTCVITIIFFAIEIADRMPYMNVNIYKEKVLRNLKAQLDISTSTKERDNYVIFG